MRPSNDPKAAPLTAARPEARRPYSKPRMKVYGAVTKLTMAGTGSVGDGGMSKMAASDRALKQDVVRLGTHPLGIGLYVYRYRSRLQEGYFLGVMADEVERVRPDAVSSDSAGYRQVDYSKLVA